MLAEWLWRQYLSSSRKWPAVGRRYGRVPGSADIFVITMPSEGQETRTNDVIMNSSWNKIKNNEHFTEMP
jgi:hypothetical protein